MTQTMSVGVVGCSITTCLLVAGHLVVAVAPIPADIATAEPRIRHHFSDLHTHEVLTETPESVLTRLTLTETYDDLPDCRLVIECTLEDIDIKCRNYGLIEAEVSDDTTYMTDQIPMKRYGTLADVATFIVSPGNSFTTGFCYDLSGGRATY